MVNTYTGINFDIYTNMIIKYGDNVTHTPVTKTTSNVSGDETLSDGTPATINVYICRKEAKWMLDKPGYIEGGDAIMLVKPTQSISKDDKITWNSNTYRIANVLNRDNPGGNVAYKVCQLFLI